jgi:hypothetical protein
MSEAQWRGESHVYGFLSVRSRTHRALVTDMLMVPNRAYRDCKEQWVRSYPPNLNGALFASVVYRTQDAR